MFATAAPPVISAVCERQLTSRLFSPHSTTRPTAECAWALRSFVVAFSCSCQRTAFWMRETAAARPVLACRGLLSGNMLREGSQAPCRRRRPFSFDASTRTRTLTLTYAHARARRLTHTHARSHARTLARTHTQLLPARRERHVVNTSQRIPTVRYEHGNCGSRVHRAEACGTVTVRSS